MHLNGKFFEKMILNAVEDKDLDQCYVRPDLGPNYLQKLAGLAAKDAANKVGNIIMFHPKWLSLPNVYAVHSSELQFLSKLAKAHYHNCTNDLEASNKKAARAIEKKYL